MKKICYLHHYASTPEKSGLLRPYFFSKYNTEYDMTIIASSFLHYSNEQLIKDKVLFKSEENDFSTFYYVRCRGYDNLISRALNMFDFMLNSIRLFNKKLYPSEYQLIVASSPHLLTMISGVYLSKKYKLPLITEVRDFWPEAIFINGFIKENSLMGKCLLKLEKHIYYNSTALIFLKPGDIEYLREKKLLSSYGGKIQEDSCFYVNNGIDLNEFHEQINDNKLDDPDLDGPEKKVIYVGSIRKVNNIMLLIEAAKTMKQKGEKCLFLIYGEGNEKEELEKFVKNNNLNNVKFKGRVQKKYVPYILSKADINVLNYSQNNYNWTRGNSSNKLFEYIAAGKPILSTVKMGYSLIDKYGLGLTMKEYNSKCMVETIIELLSLNSNEVNSIEKKCQDLIIEYDYKNQTKRFNSAIDFALRKYNKH